VIPSLYGLLSGRAQDWRSLQGSGFMRVRIYTDLDVFVSLTVTEDGRYQVVEQRSHGAARRVLRRRVPVGGALALLGWPEQAIVDEAGLAPPPPGAPPAGGAWTHLRGTRAASPALRAW